MSKFPWTLGLETQTSLYDSYKVSLIIVSKVCYIHLFWRFVDGSTDPTFSYSTAVKKNLEPCHTNCPVLSFFFFFLFTTKWPTPLIKKNKIKRKNRFPHLRPCLSQVKIFGKHNIISTPLRCCLDSHSFRQFQWIL